MTDKLRLLQSQFHFERYIRARSESAIQAIRDSGLVANAGKLDDYVGRSGGKITYAKKMMCVPESAVLNMSADGLRARVGSSERWRDAFTWEDGGLVLKKYGDVEALIDLLDERYVRSDITGEECDAKVIRA